MLTYPAIAAALHDQHRQDLTAPAQRLPAQPRRQTGPVQAISRGGRGRHGADDGPREGHDHTPCVRGRFLGTVMVPLTRWPAGRQVGVTPRQR